MSQKTITARESGERIDALLAYSGFTRSAAARLIGPGMVTANNKEYLEGMTHILTLTGDLKSPRDEVRISLRNELPDWVRQSSSMSDTSTGGSFATTTLGLDQLLGGMFNAMKGGSSFFDITIQLQK